MTRIARTAEQIEADGANTRSAAQQAQPEIGAYAADGFMTASLPVVVESVDATGARCFNTQPHGRHRIVGSFRGSCSGFAQPHNATDEYRCTECGHTSRDYVPGCKCCKIPERLPHEVTSIPAKGEPGFMSCPRQCGVDVRAHHSSDMVNGGCDTGPMAVADMIDWLEARGVGQPGYYTMAEALTEFYGKSEDDLDEINNAIHGSMA